MKRCKQVGKRWALREIRRDLLRILEAQPKHVATMHMYLFCVVFFCFCVCVCLGSCVPRRACFVERAVRGVGMPWLGAALQKLLHGELVCGPESLAGQGDEHLHPTVVCQCIAHGARQLGRQHIGNTSLQAGQSARLRGLDDSRTASKRPHKDTGHTRTRQEVFRVCSNKTLICYMTSVIFRLVVFKC